MISHPVRPFAAQQPFNADRSCNSFREISRSPAIAADRPRNFRRFFSATPLHLAAPLIKITGLAKVCRKLDKSSHVVGRVSTKQAVEPLPPSFPPFHHLDVGLTGGVCWSVAPAYPYRLDVIYRMDGHPTPSRVRPPLPQPAARHGPAARAAHYTSTAEN